MKTILSVLSLILLCSFVPWKWYNPFPVTATGNTYYVSFSAPGGNDANTTTQAKNPATPWKTLSKVNALMAAGTIINGDAVLLKAGDTWALDTLTVSKGIAVDSFGTGAKPLISGFYTVTSWTNLGGGIYESEAMPTNSAVNMVTINGQEYEMGRYPNANASNGGYLTLEAGTTSYLVDNVSRPAAVTNATWAGAMVVCRIKHYIMERSTVTSISTDTIKVSPSFATAPTANFGYFLENDFNALDLFGEWYYNPNTKKIDVFFGSGGPTGYTVKASAKNVLLTPTASNISVNNIRFEGANTYGIWNWNGGGLTGLNITNCDFNFSGIDAISLENRAAIVVQNCNINWSNGNGICMANNDDRPFISNNNVQNSGAFPGMLQRNQLSSNRYGNGILHIPKTGFFGMTCTNNYVYNSGMHGIFLDGDSMLIQNNIVDRFCVTLDDDGGIYTGNSGLGIRKGVRIINNIVRNGIGAHFGTDGTKDYAEGLYLDDGTNNVLLSGNTSYNNANNGIYLHNARKNTITNNVCYNNGTQISFQHDHVVSVAMDSNTLVGNTFMSITSSQMVQYRAKETDYNETFASFTPVCDNNYYCAPLKNEINIIQTNWFGHSQVINYNLAGGVLTGTNGIDWRATTGLDLNTKKTPIAITDPAKIFLQVNTGGVSKRYGFCTPLIGVDNTNYAKKAVVNSYSSILLLQP